MLLFVVNCGMAHEDVVARDHIADFVQDALDAIEYANGHVSSKWGGRARNGHPAPFHLRLMEIGNENGWGNTFPIDEERYARFYDAIKAKYPDMRLVANVPVRNRPMDIVDDHYYNSPEWFLANSGRYDSYDRKGPKVYVGEYAVTKLRNRQSAGFACRGGLDDGHGTKRRRGRNGFVCSSVCERQRQEVESERHRL